MNPKDLNQLSFAQQQQEEKVEDLIVAAVCGTRVLALHVVVVTGPLNECLMFLPWRSKTSNLDIRFLSLGNWD